MNPVARLFVLLLVGASLVLAGTASGKRDHGLHQRMKMPASRTRRTFEESSNAYRLAHGLLPRAPKTLHSPTRSFSVITTELESS